MAAGFVDYLRGLLGWWSAAEATPPPGGSGGAGAPRWPLSLHLYDTLDGALVYTFPSPEGLVFTENEHGFESLSGFQEMVAEQAFWLYDLAPAKWLVLSCGGFSVWEGRLEDRKLQRGGFGFTAFGAKRYLDDILYTAVWSTKSFAGIRPVTGDEVTGASPERWAMDNNNRVYIALVDGETYNDTDNYGMQVWREPHQQYNTLLEVDFDYDFALPTDWKARLLSASEDFAGGMGTVEYTFTSAGTPATGSQTVTITGGASRAYIVFQVYNESGSPVTFSGETGSQYAKFTNLRIRGSVNNPIDAKEIIEGMFSYADNLSGALIEAQNVDLTDEIFEDMYISEIMNYLASKGDDQTPPRVWEWGVWERKILFFQPRGTNALHWYVDADQLTLDSTLESLVNVAYATYQDPNGRTLRTDLEDDPDSFVKYEIIRQGVTSERTTSLSKAEITRDAFLNQRRELAPRASLTLYGLFDGMGARYPLWLARAGDTITIRNLPPTLSPEIDKVRTFRIRSLSYNVEQDVLTPAPEFPLPTLVNVITPSSISARPGVIAFTGSRPTLPDIF